MATLTKSFDYYAAIEPRLRKVAEFAFECATQQTDGVDFAAWSQVKRRFSGVVGFDRQPGKPVAAEVEAELQSSDAYEAVYRHLFNLFEIYAPKHG